MSEKKTIRFGVVGCGLMGQRHADVLRATPGASVTATADHTPELARKAAGEEGRIFETYEEMIDSGLIDAVVLCLPSSIHADYGIMAARKGLHVVTEKPIDTDPGKARALVAECNKAGVICAVISQNRFSDGAMAIKKGIEEGVLEPIRLIDASVKWMRDDPYYKESNWRGTFKWEGGGVIMNQGIHTIDLLCWMLGKPVSVKGLTKRNRDYMETEDVGVGVMEFASGALATVSVTTSCFPNGPEQISFHGNNASARFEKGQVTTWKHRDEKELPKADFAPPTEGLDPKLVLFQRQYRNILGAINGEEALLVTPEESIDVLETALALYK